ncbi:winged helix-turn-helix transcriptional regulator [Elizabethkingia ursingii]|jgi:DNA-binding HxlR family transcriptional regulator|uniref:HxlR family transcriptional regulator n=1 Tax=Elizabethkingia ursingii TaxID=1756150 RepID=A0AAJ3NEZ6_9FLAO|nr:helix-turn-helix domain-containing protein [Elizabethkingia ursingii]MDR2228337.1 helix-turn-helix transcriptional regulator [Flavobacteriaceae bacterium]AQX07615.1 HxlR family transcriptional regulator [Elizabethkingia ursingii]MCL1666042.1 helix-turn-helix transcriptional regulator [Elizabethkingia ursingii]OPB79535.1 HxlR family transcriptional regulator [Elizabethkingia ursingii]OPC05062.1 HxlR family transcriptional regulator [Elizabethkingia ursingii]
MENDNTTNSYDSAHLAIQDTLYVIGGKWKLVILCLLVSGGKMHFGELSRATGISPRILSKELQEMMLNKLVSRTVLDTKPVTVEYSATKYAKSLKEVLTAMIKWGKNHRDEIIKS